jgi:DNA replication protein DnaC
MLIQDTIDKLRELKLHGAAEELERQLPNPTIGKLPFEARLGALIDNEITHRQNKKLTILLRNARLKLNACVEEIDYSHARDLDKPLMLSLAGIEWIRQRTNLVFCGSTGTGKTWLACALGNQACRQGLSVLFIRLPLLLEDLFSAKATGTIRKKITQLQKFDLLIIDDWCLEPIAPSFQGDLLELIEARAGTRSTIITSQIPMDRWHDFIDNKTIADAILDRLVHSSHYLKLRGESMRGKAGKPRKTKRQ